MIIVVFRAVAVMVVNIRLVIGLADGIGTFQGWRHLPGGAAVVSVIHPEARPTVRKSGVEYRAQRRRGVSRLVLATDRFVVVVAVAIAANVAVTADVIGTGGTNLLRGVGAVIPDCGSRQPSSISKRFLLPRPVTKTTIVKDWRCKYGRVALAAGIQWHTLDHRRLGG